MRDVMMSIVKAQSGVSVIPSLERCVTTLRFSTKTYADDDARLARRDRPMILDDYRDPDERIYFAPLTLDRLFCET